MPRNFTLTEASFNEPTMHIATLCPPFASGGVRLIRLPTATGYVTQRLLQLLKEVIVAWLLARLNTVFQQPCRRNPIRMIETY
jgi:hypothetical protein